MARKKRYVQCIRHNWYSESGKKCPGCAIEKKGGPRYMICQVHGYWSNTGQSCTHRDHWLEERGDVEKHTGDNDPDYTNKYNKVVNVIESVSSAKKFQNLDVDMIRSRRQAAVEEIFEVFCGETKDVPVSELENNKRYDRILSLLQLAAQLQRGNFRLSDNACSAGISNMIKATGIDMEFEKIDEIVKEVIWRQAAYSGDNVESDAPDAIFGYLAHLIDQNLPY